MSPKASLITAVAVAAVAVGAAAAFAEGRLAGSQEPVATQPDPMTEDGFDRAVAAQLALAMAEDGFDRAVEAKLALQPTVSSYRDAFERADGGRPASSAPVADSPIRSGREIKWPQIGVGFGVGVLLAFLLVLAFGHTRIRSPLAH